MDPKVESFGYTDATGTKVDTEKCSACGDNLQFDPVSGCLKCPSCGTSKRIFVRAGQEIAFSNLAATHGGWQNRTHVYHCANCNAEEVLDKREIAHICPFCGSPSVVEKSEISALRPNALLPFLLDKKQAAQAARTWAKKRIFAPKSFKSYFSPENINGVYLSAFTFDAKTISYYDGKLGEYYTVTVRENGRMVTKQKTRYFSVNGEFRYFFDDIAVLATPDDKIPPKIQRTLMKFDYVNCVEYKDDFLYGFSALLYARDGETCWKEARSRAENELRGKILAQYRYDVVQYLNVNTRYSDVTYKYVLVPMYTGNYVYENKTYSFYINGRNGKVKGKTPLSPVKVALTALACVAAAVGIGLLLYFLLR